MVVPMAGVVPVVVPMVVPMVRLGLLFDKWVLIRFLLFGAIFSTVSIRQHPQRSRFKPFGQQGGSAAPGSASAARSGFHAAAASPALAAGSGAAASGSGSSAAPGPHTAAAWLAAAAAEIAPHPLDELD